MKKIYRFLGPYSISNAYGAYGPFLSNLGSNLGAYLGIRS